MKREYLKGLLGAIENADDIIDQIMTEYGKDLAKAKAESETARAAVKAYEVGGEKYIDPVEYAALKQFKADTTAKQMEERQRAAIKEALKGAKYRDTDTTLLTDLLFRDVAFAEDGTHNCAAIVEGVKKRYPDLQPQTGDTGFGLGVQPVTAQVQNTPIKKVY